MGLPSTPSSTSSDSGSRGPLDGLRVIDFSENMAGPFGTMILAEQGADVIKVEPPRGDPIRLRGTGSGEMSAYFANLNRSKRSLCIDLHHPSSRTVLEHLLADADVVVQTFRPEAASRLGIDAVSVQSAYPTIIHVSVVGFGTGGPLAGWPVYDHVIQAMSGMASLQADPADGVPRLVRQGVVDKVTGHVIAQTVCAALLGRSRSGVAEALTISMFDVALNFVWPDGMMNHTALEPSVTRPPAAETFRLTPTTDGHVAIVALTEKQWDGLAASVSMTAEDRSAVIREVRRRLASLQTDAAVELLHHHDVPCGPVLAQDAVHEHPQVAANGILTLFDHPVIGTLRQPNPVPRFAGVDPSAFRPAQRLGADSLAILAEIGLPEASVRELVDQGIVITSSPTEDAAAD